jgi:hypothetical protein
MAAIADELVDLTSGARAAELRGRGDLARAAAAAEARAGKSDPYEGLVRSATPLPADAATMYDLYAAACRAMSVDAAPPGTPQDSPARPSPLERLVRFVAKAS